MTLELGPDEGNEISSSGYFRLRLISIRGGEMMDVSNNDAGYGGLGRSRMQ
jgi:hypothetical protein